MNTPSRLFTISSFIIIATLALAGCTSSEEEVPEAIVEEAVPIQNDENVEGVTETGIIDSIEENGEVFDVAAELQEVYSTTTSSAVTGTEETKTSGLDATGLVAPSIDDSQLEAGITPEEIIEGNLQLQEEAANEQAEEAVNEEVESSSAEGEDTSDEFSNVGVFIVPDPNAPVVEEVEVVEEEPVIPAGVYEEYTSEKIGPAAERGTVVLYFHATWCPTCRVIDEDLSFKQSTLPADITLLKVDYDSSDELKNLYGVDVPHTFVIVDGDGVKLDNWTGGTTVSAVLLRANQ